MKPPALTLPIVLPIVRPNRAREPCGGTISKFKGLREIQLGLRFICVCAPRGSVVPRPRQFPPSPAGPLAYFQHLQAAALTFVVTHTQGAVVTASFGPIYCYWRIEQELLHTVYSQQLTRWQGADIQGHLLQILGQWQQGAEPRPSGKRAFRLFNQIDHEIGLQLSVPTNCGITAAKNWVTECCPVVCPLPLRPFRFLAIDSTNKRHLSTSEKRGLRKGPS